jgi:hypothetical protein
MLSSETEQITHGSFGFHEKSEIFAVCPPWMNCETDNELYYYTANLCKMFKFISPEGIYLLGM